jgi:hypothetical protein
VIPFGKKKPGVTVAIGIGKPKVGDLGTPDPLEKALGSAKGPSAAHEAAETPEYEEQEETGAGMIDAMTQPLVDAGLSGEDAKSLLADIFDAVCKSLRGGKESAEPPAEEAAEPPEPDNYGR